MKSNVPWSVKGIDPEARAVAKEAARKAGMTLGEWMTTMIREVGNDDRLDATDPARHAGVSTDQLRAVVDSLNRLHERLRHTEEEVKKSHDASKEAVGGLNTAVETVFERLKRLEKERKEGGDDEGDLAESSAELEQRLEKLEQGGAARDRIEGLKSLEQALTQMVEQFEATRAEAIARVEKNEEAVLTLKDRVDVIDDKLSAGFEEVNDALDRTQADIERTERTAKAVLLEAKEAAGSDDAEFVERTGKKLQALGNEIKRSGDQITAVEQMVSNLVGKIEAAEHRSAEGIADVAAELEALREELSQRGLEEGSAEAASAFVEATEEAERTVASLQRSYDEIVARLEGRELPPLEDDPVADDAYPDLSAQQREADTLEADSRDNDDEFDAVFGSQDGHDAGRPDEMSLADDGTDEDRPLSPREKILAAARARKERLEKERAALQNAPVIEDPASEEHVIAEDPAADTGATSSQTDDGRNRKIGIPLLLGLGVVIVGGITAATLFLGGDAPSEDDAPAEAIVAVPAPTGDARPTVTASDGVATTPETQAPVLTPATDGRDLYEEAKSILDTANLTEEQRAEGFALMSEAANSGYPPARYRLGELYMEGIGTEQDLANARRWLSAAAFAGNAPAMHRLGTLAIDPNFNGQDLNEGLDWFAKAAEFGVVDSMYNLGFLYDPSSDLLPVDMRNAERSYFWYSLAARRDDPIAQEDAAKIAADLSPDTKTMLDEDIAAWREKNLDPAANDIAPASNADSEAE